MDDHYERLRVRALEAIADHERGELDHAGLQATLADVQGAVDHRHGDVRQALFEADVALEYAQYGQRGELETYDPDATMRRMRRNLREALGWY